MTPHISIIIVNFNSDQLLQECIASIKKHIVSVEFEIVVVDNASTDGSVDFLINNVVETANVHLILNHDNVGFAVANNMAAKVAKGKYLHFLNPDTLATPSLDAGYVTLMNQRDERRVYTTLIQERTGGLAKTRYLLPIISNYLVAVMKPAQAKYWYIGASVVMTQTMFLEIGGWPEDYFMYAEDLDLFYQLAQRNIYVEQLNAIVIHTSQGTTRKVWSNYERLLNIERSYRLFSHKYQRMLDYYVTRMLTLLRLCLRNPAEAQIMITVMRESARHA